MKQSGSIYWFISGTSVLQLLVLSCFCTNTEHFWFHADDNNQNFIWFGKAVGKTYINRNQAPEKRTFHMLLVLQTLNI